MREETRNHRGRHRTKFTKDHHREDSVNFTFPSPSMLESYNEIYPGLASKMADLLKSEQKHRHEWENKYLNSMVNTARIGQLFGAIVAVMIIYSTILVADDKNNAYLATVICISGFAFLACAALASFKTKQYMKKPSHFRHTKK